MKPRAKAHVCNFYRHFLRIYTRIIVKPVLSNNSRSPGTDLSLRLVSLPCLSVSRQVYERVLVRLMRKTVGSLTVAI